MPSDDTQSIQRVNENGATVTVVAKQREDFYRWDRRDALSHEWPDLFTHVAGPDTIRVGTAVHVADDEGFAIHGGNAVYAEVPLVERELTDAEIRWCEDSIYDVICSLFSCCQSGCAWMRCDGSCH